jgi:hypothetical protein
MDYQEYLKSKHWRKFRQVVLAFWDERCSVCKSQFRIEVHHNNYRNLGHEALSDVICLCSLCHELFSNRLKPREVEPIQVVMQRLQERYAAKHWQP